MSEQLEFDGYVEAWVIADGAVSDSQTFKYGEGKQLDAWLIEKKGEASRHGTPRVEIYLLSHDHSPNVEDCTCVQYLQDHRPFWKNYIRAEIKEEGQ